MDQHKPKVNIEDQMRERLLNLPQAKKAKLMFQIKRGQAKMKQNFLHEDTVFEIDHHLKDFNCKENEFLKKCTIPFLTAIEAYFQIELENPERRFTKKELSFYISLSNLVWRKSSGLEKMLTFFFSRERKKKFEILKSIKKLGEERKERIKNQYATDIEIVNEFLLYAKQKTNSGEIFYYLADYANSSWTKVDFPKRMFNYLLHKFKLDQRSLSEKYLNSMRGYFSIIGLGLSDKEKVLRANQYYSKSKDPFSFNIPASYSDVRSEILMAPIIMSENEKLLSKIVEDINSEYSD